ncbi:MAG TPA: Ser-Thr-rich GPI-anchored membrane family protein, partial [Candidatus Paceibacterota bacterium]|nr:Ser-Thr-rich GPI-anchored membrane family protein [Candidatus Paceibacterota bacterium]
IQDQYGNQNSCSTQANVIPRTGCTGNSSCQSAQTPYGVGTNGQACGQPPAQPDPSQCTTGSWQPTSASGNGCTTGFQCVPNGSSSGTAAPTAQLSCSPQTVEVGQSVAVAYACGGGSTTASSDAFTANGLSGSATIVVPQPPANTNTATYRLACSNAQGQTAGAQCSVQINQPSIVLVANPAQVPTGQTTTIGWVTAGMQSCVVSSPTDTSFTAQNASNKSVGGMATTNPITQATEYDLTCTTIGGQTTTASTTVKIGASATTQNVQVTSSADARTVNHGDTVTIQWQSQNAPSNSAVALWLVDLHTQAASALIAGQEPTSGSYQWTIPATGSSCNTNSPIACASDLLAGNSYGIEAAVYQPANAFLGGSQVPSGAVNPSYSDSGYTPNPFSIGQ